MTRARWSGVLAVATLVVYALQVGRFWFLGDDAYISFRYAQNLVDGLGLVWQPGEPPVEGYTNFAWVLLLAAGMLVGIGPEVAAPAIGVVCGGLVLAAVAQLGASRRGWSDPRIWTAPLLLVCTRSFPAWSTGGLETQWFTLLCFTGPVLAAYELRGEARGSWSSWILSLAVLTRPEGVMFAGITAVFVLAHHARRGSLGRFVVWATPWIATLAAHLAFRWSYYGDWVPNTFHAKVNGLWLDQGLTYLGWFHEDYAAGWYAWLAVVAVVLARTRVHALLLALVTAQVAHAVVIGGDRFEFRFLVHVFPAFFWLVSEGLWELADRASRSPRGDARGAIGLAVGAACTIGLFALLGSLEGRARSRGGIATIATIDEVAKRRAHQGRRLRELIDSGVLPEPVACFQALGAVSYHSRLRVLDYHGLTNAEIARRRTPRRGLVAHEKFATVADMRAHDVHLYDPVGRVVVPATESAAARSRIEEKLARRHFDGLIGRCRLVAPGEHLVYATPMSAADEEAMFGHLPRCPVARP